jgi:hypothetical protein
MRFGHRDEGSFDGFNAGRYRSKGNFGIKLFYPKIGGHVFAPKFGRCLMVNKNRFKSDAGFGYNLLIM